MSKRGNNVEFVKHVPDFLAKMGLSRGQVEEHQDKNKEHKLEDKFPKKKQKAEGLAQEGHNHSSNDEEDKEYDFENAQIEDLANMLQGGPVSSD